MLHAVSRIDVIVYKFLYIRTACNMTSQDSGLAGELSIKKAESYYFHTYTEDRLQAPTGSVSYIYFPKVIIRIFRVRRIIFRVRPCLYRTNTCPLTVNRMSSFQIGTALFQVWAYFRIKPMLTYKSVFRHIRKYEYDGVFHIFENMTKYDLAYFFIISEYV